jgi:5-methylcytosine-specific restriction endonuclease McrBC regulatory subunit McrC
MTAQTTDNTKKTLSSEEASAITDLNIAGKNIETLIAENPKLLVFPDSIRKTADRISNRCIFSLSGNILETYNLMGFIGLNQTRITINSRFSKQDPSDYFLHYMLQKALHINLFDFSLNIDNDPVWEWYAYLFPFFLNKAMGQGVYKEYIRKQYNDAHIKGVIDVPRHIKQNTPFLGSIAYSVREYCTDNPVTQLIRHAIEYIKDNNWKAVLSSSGDVIDQVRYIVSITQTYRRLDKPKIIHVNNAKPLRHPYFTEYKNLQTLCLHILQRDKISFGNERDAIFGIVFDGAWLWEEYLNAVFQENNMVIDHPQNKTQTGGDSLFKDGGQMLYPDFIKRKEGRQTAYYIADAKYKHSALKEDYYQLITYMYRYETLLGYLLFPHEDNDKHYDKSREIDGNLPNKVIREIGLPIPVDQKDYISFCNAMKNHEKALCGKI